MVVSAQSTGSTARVYQGRVWGARPYSQVCSWAPRLLPPGGPADRRTGGRGRGRGRDRGGEGAGRIRGGAVPGGPGSRVDGRSGIVSGGRTAERASAVYRCGCAGDPAARRCGTGRRLRVSLRVEGRPTPARLGRVAQRPALMQDRLRLAVGVSDRVGEQGSLRGAEGIGAAAPAAGGSPENSRI